ncbi:RlmF-related methyltransferase [Methanocaldococcus indicus]|uniref:RlmF-related methyltransferase n=1 Tax=Methanocaldococcus indicus TaxID=213231 RepID=UPI003C6D6B88
MEGLKIEDAIKINPNLKKYVFYENNKYKIDFKNKDALIEYNKAILKHLFNLDVDFSREHLIPAVLSRYLFVKSSFETLNKLNIKNPKVLEVGTGSGVIALLIKKLYSSSEVVTTEIDETLYNLAKNNFIKNNLNIEIIKSNGEILNLDELKNRKFNLIICYPPFYSDNSVPSKKRFGGALAKTHELIGGGKFGELFCYKLIDESYNYLDKGLISIMLPKKPEKRRELIINKMKEYYTVEVDNFTVGKRVRYVIKGIK